MRARRNVLVALGSYDHRIHRGIARYAGRFNWHVNCDMCVSGILPRSWVGDGIITYLTNRADLARFVSHAAVPVVDLTIIRHDIPLPRVVGDQEAIGRQAAEHFLERGFRHFVWCASNDLLLWEMRRRGFAQTLARHGLKTEAWIWKLRGPRHPDPWRTKQQWLAEKLKAIPKPVAVFAFNDYEAANVLDGCTEANLSVPDDVAILGVDNNELVCDCLHVPLSSVHHDLERLGYEGAALLHRLMLGQRAPTKPLLIPPRGVVVRRSTEVLAVNHEPCRRALKFVQENTSPNIGVVDVSAASGIPRRSLEHAFRKNLGRSIREEIARARLAKVKSMLQQTDLSVADIAARAGFKTPQYLNLVFKKSTGMPPRKFRVARRVPVGPM